MHCLAFAIDYSSALPLIVGTGMAMYVASKAITDALVAGRSGLAGRLAVGQWLPIAMLAVASAITHRQLLAIALIFSSSVACLSLAVGTVGYLGAPSIPVGARRGWALLVPVALLTFLAGFRSSVTLPNAGILALEGICVLLLWNDRPDQKQELSAVPSLVPLARRGMVFRLIEMILGLLVAAVGCWFAMHAIDRAAMGNEFTSPGLLTTTLLAPLMVLPIIGNGTELSQRNESVTAITSQVGVALLNLCCLLPMVVVASYLQQMIAGRLLVLGGLSPFPFPLGVWRVDAVMLIALGLFLLPIAIGKWSLSRVQGVGLMLGYAIYLGLTVMWQAYILFGVR